MNTLSKKHATLFSISLLAALPAPVLAGLITVNSTADPEVPVSANCQGAAQACTLREALAAADETAEHDVILFDIEQPIQLTRKLTAHQPVTLDGGGHARIHVHQDYSIVMLPDKYTENIVPVLQPQWSTVGAGARYMMELFGSGSEILNLEIDGSIRPAAGEITVERVDFDSDGVTDYVLHNVGDDDQAIWPVAGGLLVDFYAGLFCEESPPLGTVTISGNKLKNLSGDGILLAFHVQAQITDNMISGGAWPEPGFNYDGIFAYCGGAAQVSGNQVEGYRSGIKMGFATASSITDNQAQRNRTGIEVEFMGGDFGPNVVADNVASANLEHGIKASYVSATGFMNNLVFDNGVNPELHGGILLAASADNTLEGNRVSDNPGFGLVLDSAWLNTVADNWVGRNGGGGIVLVNDAQFNSLTGNRSTRNQVGMIMAVTAEGAPPPSNNSMELNSIVTNQQLDVFDADPNCNDAWLNNRLGTVYAASGSCIQ